MFSDIEGPVTHCFRQLSHGDQAATAKLWEHFFPRLVGLARKHLAGRSQRVADAEDAAQSAFISFWQRAQQGDFAGELHRNNLWNLLSVITVRKALKHLERERTEKRGGGNVHGESSLAVWAKSQGREFKLEEALGYVPAHEFDLVCEEFLMALDEELRAFAILRLMGYKNRESAGILECSERKVERKLVLIRRSWEDKAAV